MRVVITVEEGNCDVSRLALKPGESLLLGRDTACDLPFNDDRMSSQHCRVQLGGQGVVVTDLNSTNGTTLNGQVVSNPTVVQTDCSLEIGSARLHIAIQGGQNLPTSGTQTGPTACSLASIDSSATASDPDPPSITRSNRSVAPFPPVSAKFSSVGLSASLRDGSTQSVWLRPGQRLVVGTDEQQSDWVFPFDDQLRPRHAELTVEPAGCLIRAVGGFLSASDEVTERTLADGDHLVIGSTPVRITWQKVPQSSDQPSSSWSLKSQHGSLAAWTPSKFDVLRFVESQSVAGNTVQAVLFPPLIAEVADGRVITDWLPPATSDHCGIGFVGQLTAQHLSTWINKEELDRIILVTTSGPSAETAIKLAARGQIRSTQVPDMSRVWTADSPRRLIDNWLASEASYQRFLVSENRAFLFLDPETEHWLMLTDEDDDANRHTG